MARININEKWKTDPRRMALDRLLGDPRLSTGMLVEIHWLLWDHKGQGIPLNEFKFVRNHQEWLDCGLGIIDGEWVRISGQGEMKEFFDKQRLNAEKGSSYGVLGGRPRKNNAARDVTPKNPQKPPSFSISSSSSFSNSSLNNNNTNTVVTRERKIKQRKSNTEEGAGGANSEFKKFALEYKKEFPNTTSGGNAASRFAKLSPGDVSDLWLALANYKLMLKAEAWRHPKTSVATFLGSERSGFFWRDFIEPLKVVPSAGMCGIAEG